MIKKRIKRALRAVGLLKPHDSGKAALAANRGLSLADARIVVRQLYRSILRREADKEGCEAFAGHLASGSMSHVDVVRSLIESAEFSTAYSRHPNVAKSLSTALTGWLMRTADKVAVTNYAAALAGGVPVGDVVKELCQSPRFRNTSVLFAVHPQAAAGIANSMISSLTGRDATDADSRSYGEALASGYSVKAFLDELCNSPEFRATWGVGYSSLQGRPAVPSEIGQLAEELIAARLVRDGGILGLPPVNTLDRPPVAAKQVVAMLRTLDMLADRPAG